MTPQIANESLGDIKEYRQPNRTYRLNEKNIDGTVDDIESVKQAIFHILQTERYSNPIYDDDYGVELEQYIGKDISVIIADIELTLNEALTQDDRIKNVHVDSVQKIDSSSCLIQFTVDTILGELKEELNVLQ